MILKIRQFFILLLMIHIPIAAIGAGFTVVAPSATVESTIPQQQSSVVTSNAGFTVIAPLLATESHIPTDQQQKPAPAAEDPLQIAIRESIEYARSLPGPKKSSIKLLTHFYENMLKPSDIGAHMPYLFAIALKCSSVLELGTGKNFRATWAFLRGIAESEFPQKKLMVGVDLLNIPETTDIKKIATEHDIEYHFHQESDLTLPIKEMYGSFDLTFIDTWHCFGQLRRELEIFPAITKKYLIFHDVNIDGIYGEELRFNRDLSQSVATSGFSYVDVALGLRPALNNFMAVHGTEWRTILWTEDDVGLAVLERINPLP